MSVAGGLWTIFFLIAALRVLGEWRRAASLSGDGLREVSADIRDGVGALRRDMGVATEVSVRQSIRAEVPMVLGWPAATILLPPSALSRLSGAELRSIIRHELAHVLRRDYLINILQIIVETLLYHHPAAAWLSKRARIDREYCCDDIAIRNHDDRAVYAHALANLDEARGTNRLVVAAASGTLLDRISRLAGQPRREISLVRAIGAFIVATAVAGTIAVLSMAAPPTLPTGTRLKTPNPAPTDVIPRGRMLPRRPRSS